MFDEILFDQFCFDEIDDPAPVGPTRLQSVLVAGGDPDPARTRITPADPQTSALVGGGDPDPSRTTVLQL